MKDMKKEGFWAYRAFFLIIEDPQSGHFFIHKDFFEHFELIANIENSMKL